MSNAENSIFCGFEPFSDDELRLVSETVASKLEWVNRGDPFGPWEMLRDAARMLATIEHVREEALDDCTRFVKQRNTFVDAARRVVAWWAQDRYTQVEKIDGGFELHEALREFDARV